MDAERAVKLANLSETQQEVFYLRWILGLSQGEVAAVTGKSQSAVSQNLSNAKAKIQIVLDSWRQ